MNNKQKQCVVVYIFDGNKILLYRRINTWYQENKLALIGGNVDEGETPSTAAIREVFEETNIVINPEDLHFIKLITQHEKEADYLCSYFYCKNWTGTPKNMEPDRCGGLQWEHVNDLPQDTIPIIKEVAKEILN